MSNFSMYSTSIRHKACETVRLLEKSSACSSFDSLHSPYRAYVFPGMCTEIISQNEDVTHNEKKVYTVVS